MNKTFQRSGLAIGLLYQGGLIALYAMRALAAHDGPWWLAFLSVWEPWWYAPLPLVIGLALGLVKSPGPRLALVAVPLGLWLMAFGELFWPNAAQPGQPTLTVLTFNVRYDRHSPEQVLEVVLQANADVVALQELPTALDDFLWDRLQGAYPYRLSEAADWPWGSGLYSRYPLTLVENRAWQNGHLDTQEAQLDWNGRSVRVLNFHPAPPALHLATLPHLPIPIPYDYRADVRHGQVVDLVTRLEALPGPLILACDCNLDPGSYDYELITRQLADGFREAGWGFGHTLYFNDRPNWLQDVPLVRIDYVFHSRDWQAVEARVWPDASSNHRPVVVQLALP